MSLYEIKVTCSFVRVPSRIFDSLRWLQLKVKHYKCRLIFHPVAFNREGALINMFMPAITGMFDFNIYIHPWISFSNAEHLMKEPVF
jgi:hypothetical protein